MSQTTLAASGRLSPEMVEQFHQEGYMILERALPDDVLAMMREECSYFLGYKDAQLDAAGREVDSITHKRKRYFISNLYRKSPRIWRYMFSDLMAGLASATLGPQVYLFNEQWVVKGAEQGMKFSWHQDSGYVKFRDQSTYHKPYLTTWLALDDMSEANGTIYILPHSRAGTRERIFDHAREDGTNDLVGYDGDDPGLPVIVPAGSIAAFSSFTFHRSGANTTPNMRRVYLAQYSSEPIVESETGKLWNQAVPFVKDGRNVYDPKADGVKL